MVNNFKSVFACICVSLCLICIFPSYSSALTIPSLYSDLNGGTQFNNLLNYATRYESFYNSSYIALRDSQNSYYLIWGDKDSITAVDNVVTGSDCSYVRYYRESISSDWKYLYIHNDTVNLSCDKLVTTNLTGVQGFASVDYYEWDFWTSVRRLFVVSFSIFMAIGLSLVLRRR